MCKSKRALQTYFCSAKRCLDSPDTADSTGAEAVIWNGNNCINDFVTYRCPVGQAFTDHGVREVRGDCNYRRGGDQQNQQIYWRWNSTNKLTTCSRKLN